jgi:hypothetical protein
MSKFKFRPKKQVGAGTYTNGQRAYIASIALSKYDDERDNQRLHGGKFGSVQG